MNKRIWILTLFPDYFIPFAQWGVVGKVLTGERQLAAGLKLEMKLVRMGDFCSKGHKGLDDAPFGGGPGMLMRADRLKEVLDKAVIAAGGYDPDHWQEQLTLIYTSPRGQQWNQALSQKMAQNLFFDSPKDLVFICGRYEGVDERFLNKYVNFEFSIGDYVLSGGELAVQVCLDTMLRQLEGTLGEYSSLSEESFNQNRLEGPQYTRPRLFEGMEVPEVYLSGHGQKIEAYRNQKAAETTLKWRPDLMGES